jgi:hypothetical protein
MTRWKLSQLAAILGIVGKLVGAVSMVVEALVVTVVVVDVVLEGSSVAVPITQYDLLVSRLGQVIPGLSCFRLSTESP